MSFEKKFFLLERPFWLVASDEAGRGPLAGPVVAGAVALKVEDPKAALAKLTALRRLGVQDSKIMKLAHREQVLQTLGWSHSLESELQSQWIGGALLASWAQCDHTEIDRINILQASLKAMHQAARVVAQTEHLPVCWLIDGNRAPKDVDTRWRVHPVVSGDAKSVLIGLASVIAKVTRDRLMLKLHHCYPQYGFDTHAGYPTPSHRQALQTHGPSPVHRQSFGTVKAILEGSSARA